MGSPCPLSVRRFDNSQIAAIAAYLRTTQAGLPPWQNLEATVQSVRAHAGTN